MVDFLPRLTALDAGPKHRGGRRPTGQTKTTREHDEADATKKKRGGQTSCRRTSIQRERKRARERERETDRHTDRQTDRQTEIERERDRQTDRQSEPEFDRAGLHVSVKDLLEFDLLGALDDDLVTDFAQQTGYALVAAVKLADRPDHAHQTHDFGKNLGYCRRIGIG